MEEVIDNLEVVLKDRLEIVLMLVEIAKEEEILIEKKDFDGIKDLAEKKEILLTESKNYDKMLTDVISKIGRGLEHEGLNSLMRQITQATKEFYTMSSKNKLDISEMYLNYRMTGEI